MRILVLTKRQHTGKDLLDDRYGRLYELPLEAAMLGNRVSGLCLSYRTKGEGRFVASGGNDCSVDWFSMNLGRFVLPGFMRYLHELDAMIRDFRPDIIFAGSDAVHCIVGKRYATKHNIPCVLDLYDNFESFALSKTPGVLYWFRKAVSEADGICCVSDQLRRYVTTSYQPSGVVITLTNGVPANLFEPQDKIASRRELGLPHDAVLIGTAGALNKNRGIGLLLDGYAKLSADDPDIHLVLAGPLDSRIRLPDDSGVHYLGELAYEKIPALFSALDVGVICNFESEFGKYCFPLKAYEMMACDLPIVAANVGVMAELLSEFPQHLYSPGDVVTLIEAIRSQLTHPHPSQHSIVTWSQQAEKLVSVFEEICC